MDRRLFPEARGPSRRDANWRVFLKMSNYQFPLWSDYVRAPDSDLLSGLPDKRPTHEQFVVIHEGIRRTGDRSYSKREP